MKVGISTACFFPLETEKALWTLLDNGVEEIEVFLNSFSELEPGYLAKMRSLLAGFGAHITAVHPFTSNLEDMLFSAYDRRRRDMREFYQRYFEMAASLGAPYVILHGPNKMFHMSREFYAEQFALLGRAAEGMGVRLLQENVERCMSRDPELLRYLRGAVPGMGFALDLKQAKRCGVAVPDLLEALGGSIAHLHFSDQSKADDCLWPGEGETDIPQLVDRLHAVGFDGCLMVEVYGCGAADCARLLDSVKMLQGIVRGKGY